MKVDKFFFNKIYYINADFDSSVHRDLFQSITNYSIFYSNEEIECEYKYINSKGELKDYLREIKQNISNGKFPFIHITCHGGDKGIKLPSSGRLFWNELAHFLLEINITCKNNLFVVFACCEGAYIALPMINRILATNNDRKKAPLFGYIGAVGKISLKEIETGFTEFYELLFKGFSSQIYSLDSAIDKLRKATDTPVQVASCRFLFERIVESFLRESIKKFKNDLTFDAYILERLKEYFRKTGEAPNFENYSKLRNILMDEKFLIDLYNKLRKTYFMIDLYPENDTRFDKIGSISNWNNMLRNINRT